MYEIISKFSVHIYIGIFTEFIYFYNYIKIRKVYIEHIPYAFFAKKSNYPERIFNIENIFSGLSNSTRVFKKCLMVLTGIFEKKIDRISTNF